MTWTVFRFLQKTGHMTLVPPLCGLASSEGATSLLLWGAPAGGGEADLVREHYEQISDALCEKPRRRTEIDVLVAWRDLLVAIEVKYRSGNDQKAGRASRLRRYVRPGLFAADVGAVDDLGFYELARNWSLGTALAESLKRRFLLVNLGPEDLAKDMDLLRPQLCERTDGRAAFYHGRVSLMPSRPPGPHRNG